MSGINKVILVGHLGKDPELRLIDNEVAVASFPLVTAESFIKNGAKTEQTEWHNSDVARHGRKRCKNSSQRKVDYTWRENTYPVI